MTNEHSPQLQRVTVLHLSGSIERIVAVHRLGAACDVRPIHDFIVAKPKDVLQLLRSVKGQRIVIATKDLRYQRFRTVWKMYAALSGARAAMFADELGATDRFGWAKLAAVELPLLMLEACASIVTLAVGWLRLVRYRPMCR